MPHEKVCTHPLPHIPRRINSISGAAYKNFCHGRNPISNAETVERGRKIGKSNTSLQKDE